MNTQANAYIVAGVRTPIGRYGGVLASIRPDDLAAAVIHGLLERVPSVEPAAVDEVMFGCSNQAGEDNRNVARMATLLAGLPVEVPGTTINRLCGSGMDAVAQAARSVRVGDCDLVIAGGVESMSRAPFVLGKPERGYARDLSVQDTTLGWRFVNPRMQQRYGVDSMPETAENVASDFSVSREDQDRFALRSQERTQAAKGRGRFEAEIMPVAFGDAASGQTFVSEDEHPRQTSYQDLMRLPARFRDPGTVTAGNSSGLNDGAAALLIASETAVNRFGLEPLVRVVTSASAGVEPRLMGIGPVPATQKLLSQAGWNIGDFDLIEINEAFAAQVLACLRMLGLADDAEHVNPNGGAIALGHPLGMSGARLALTAAVELKLRGAQRALCTMCIGVGQGISIALEAP